MAHLLGLEFSFSLDLFVFAVSTREEILQCIVLSIELDVLRNCNHTVDEFDSGFEIIM